MASTMPTLMTPAILLLHSYYFLLGFDIAAKRHVWNSNTVVHETCRYATINHSHQSPPPPPPPHISYILLLINGRSLFVGFFNIDKTREQCQECSSTTTTTTSSSGGSGSSSSRRMRWW